MSAELKEDLKGRKEFEDYLARLNIQKADLQAKIEKNKAWIVSVKESLTRHERNLRLRGPHITLYM